MEFQSKSTIITKSSSSKRLRACNNSINLHGHGQQQQQQQHITTIKTETEQQQQEQIADDET